MESKGLKVLEDKLIVCMFCCGYNGFLIVDIGLDDFVVFRIILM